MRRRASQWSAVSRSASRRAVENECKLTGASSDTHKDTTRMTTDHEEVYEADEGSTFNKLVSRETAEARTRG